MMIMTEDEDVLKEIARYRTSAQALGDAALEAMQRGDIGLARTSARQAAQHARVALSWRRERSRSSRKPKSKARLPISCFNQSTLFGEAGTNNTRARASCGAAVDYPFS
ncbi:MAG TPA: hypothetical protein VGO91_12175 [Pyrinomonadaceae bacterium]|nr:hypothetical protein [Pyrinomonadaceae bacterium]